MFEYGTSWVNPEKYSFPDKKFSLSFVCNTKYHNQGHILRHEIYYNQDKINIPIDFYLSSKNPDSNDLFYKQSELKNLFNNKNAAIINPVTGKAYELGDQLPNGFRDPNYPDPQDNGAPPFNPARYLTPRQMMLGLTWQF